MNCSKCGATLIDNDSACTSCLNTKTKTNTRIAMDIKLPDSLQKVLARAKSYREQNNFYLSNLFIAEPTSTSSQLQELTILISKAESCLNKIVSTQSRWSKVFGSSLHDPITSLTASNLELKRAFDNFLTIYSHHAKELLRLATGFQPHEYEAILANVSKIDYKFIKANSHHGQEWKKQIFLELYGISAEQVPYLKLIFDNEIELHSPHDLSVQLAGHDKSA